jgi:SAM-dependent methyltransferase
MTETLRRIGQELRRYYYAAEKRLPHNLVFARQARRLFGGLRYIEVLQYLHETRRFRRYLEIGVATGGTLTLSKALVSYGVDPDFNLRFPLEGNFVLVRTTSDRFFAEYAGEKFDFAFVDGLHVAQQVAKDIFNASRVLVPGGLIALHDTVPINRVVASPTRYTTVWTGDVYRALLPYLDRFPADVLTFLAPPSGLSFIKASRELLASLEAPLAPCTGDHRSCMRRIVARARQVRSLTDLEEALLHLGAPAAVAGAGGASQ